VLGPEIEAAAQLISSGQILAATEAVCGTLRGAGGHAPR